MGHYIILLYHYLHFKCYILNILNINLLELVKNKEMKDDIFFEINIFLKIQCLLTINKNPGIKTIIDSILNVLGIEEVFDQSGNAIADGNKKVFEEILKGLI